MPVERRDVEASLAKKGFVASKGDHRFFTYYTLADLKTSTWTKTSHGSEYKTLGDGLVNAMEAVRAHDRSIQRPGWLPAVPKRSGSHPH
jgi:predicted RNA binding protein YcfA (HicA-like mRNA interferase family)